jgi:hypothetical protein
MATSRQTDTDSPLQPSDTSSTLARALAPEDIRRGDYVALLDEVWELPSFWWCADATLLPPDVPVRIRFIPREEAVPLRVLQVCLPFVFAKHPTGSKRTVDIRRTRLARLHRRYAATAWKAYKKVQPSTRTSIL